MSVSDRPKSWKTIRSTAGSDLKLFKTRWDAMQNPRTGQVMDRLVLETPDWVNIVPVTTDNHVILVRQYRFGVSKVTLEIPGGLIDSGEDSLRAAQRELLEETGYGGGEWIYLGAVQPNPAFHTNLCHHWLAKNVSKVSEPQQDPGEDIVVDKISFTTARSLIKEGDLAHVLALSALSRVRDIWGLLTKDSQFG